MIQGEKINLRLVQRKDLAQLLKLINNLSNRSEYLGTALTSEVLITKHFDETGFWQDDFGRMLIISKNNKILGNITFYRTNTGYEIGYQIYKKENRGKGYGSEALRLFSKYLFKLKEINRLQITIPCGNVASKRIAERCGYKYEGTMRQSHFAAGKYYDVQLFSLLREEFK